MLRAVAFMIQLAFEPAYDPFHAAFRVLRQSVYLNYKPAPASRIKILDVYVAEPIKCLDIRLAGALKASARRAAKCQHPTYGHRPTARSLLNRMSLMQDAAIQTLVMQGIIDGDGFGMGQIQLIKGMLPAELLSKINNANANQADLMKFLLNDLNSIPFEGLNGLKDRTGLGEFRYDIV